MRTDHLTRRALIALIGTLVLTSIPMSVVACTRLLFTAKDGTVITGRSMDWGEDLKSNMWVFPRGMKRDGMGGKNSISWESKYGSLIVSGYDIENKPWVSSTIWRTVSDSTNRIVMFDSAMTPATFWVRLDDLDFRSGAPVKKFER